MRTSLLLSTVFVLSLACGLVRADSACPACDDGNPCTVDTCIELTQTCQHTPVSCDDGNSCTIDSCLPATGGGYACRNDQAPDETPCDDGNSCTRPDVCHAGVCAGDPVAPEACDDGNPCTYDDACDAGVCKGTAADAGSLCDDGNSCTIGDACTADARCVGQPLHAGDACNDGNACTSNDRCSDSPVGLVCLGTSLCDDGNPCTEDHCDAATGTCSHPPVSCDDRNACTADSCDPAAGRCVHQNVTGSCEDGNACTVGDFCSDGKCVGGGARDCGPGTTCLRYICDPSYPGGCEPQPTGAACGPADQCSAYFCNSQFVCQRQVHFGNTCQSSPPDPCNTYRCSTHGTCDFFSPSPAGTACDDHNACTIQDACTGVLPDQCAGTAVNCDDGNACTADSCDSTVGCRHDPLAAPVTCGVGACTRTIDACQGGTVHECVPGAPHPEIACNLVDDDCNGLVDENNVMASCTVMPRILRDGGILKRFTVTCTLRDRCVGNQLLSPLGAAIVPAWISAADRLGDAGDNVTFPDPGLSVCAAPDAGPERGLAEDTAMRQVDSDSITFVFDRPSDGVCSTLDGGRPDLVALLQDLPDGALARVCVGSRYNDRPFEGCGVVRVRH